MKKLLLLIPLLLLADSCDAPTPPCVKSHQEVEHHTGTSNFMYTGNIMMINNSPAYDSIETICDQYETATSTK